MYSWHGDVIALSGDVAILQGSTILGEGIDAVRVRLKAANVGQAHPFARWATGLATDAGNGAMAVIIKAAEGIALGDRILVDLDLRAGRLQPPAKKSRTLFGINPDTLTAEQRRWLRQAVLFALEAREPDLRAIRLQALGVRSATTDQ